jgi:hypothetical protein
MPTTTPVSVYQSSKQYSLGVKDLLQSLLAAIIAPVLPMVTESLQSGSLTINWKSIGVAAALGFVTWITKNFLQPSQTTITGTVEGTSINVTAPPAGTTKSVNIAPSIPPPTKP